MKIMIMDPQPLSRERVVDLIKGQPDVEIVGDGNPGSEMVEQALVHRPGIILMSASLFEEVGKELMNVVVSENPETAFVILAPSEDANLMLSVMRNGGKGYLPKNISEASLLKSLYAVGRGEIAIPWAMVSEVVDELQRVSKAAYTKENEKPKMLTLREVEAPGLLASEASNAEIGRELFISNNTVRFDVHNISEKLQTRKRRNWPKAYALVLTGLRCNTEKKETFLKVDETPTCKEYVFPLYICSLSHLMFIVKG